MKLISVILAAVCFVSCKNHNSLSRQLTEVFKTHLLRVDSSASIDSVHVLWNVRITQKMGGIIEDTVYQREFARIQSQLAASTLKRDKDSAEFYQYEINYMTKEIDTLNHSIGHSDTTHSYGHLIGCTYSISKNQKSRTDSTVVVIDTGSSMQFTDILDSSLRKSVRLLN